MSVTTFKAALNIISVLRWEGINKSVVPGMQFNRMSKVLWIYLKLMLSILRAKEMQQWN